MTQQPIIPTEKHQQRFAGVRKLYGEKAYQRFTQAHICVIGLGGVGSWAAEALARNAIGRLTLIDLDNVVVSNINRQLLALENNIGMAKVNVMAQRISLINPDCQVHIIEDFINQDNLDSLITTELDYCIDCIDNFRTKAALIAHCKRNKLKIVVTGGAGGQINPLKIKISDLSRCEHDPLLAQLKRSLRRDYNFPRNLKRRFDIPCVYSSEHLIYPTENGGTTLAKTMNNSGLHCGGGLGSSVAVTASFGFAAAAHVLNKLKSYEP